MDFRCLLLHPTRLQAILQILMRFCCLVFSMHDQEIPLSVKTIARAGARAERTVYYMTLKAGSYILTCRRGMGIC
jgi:hypothetical protein